jgi:hypothetical protein
MMKRLFLFGLLALLAADAFSSDAQALGRRRRRNQVNVQVINAAPPAVIAVARPVPVPVAVPRPVPVPVAVPLAPVPSR